MGSYKSNKSICFEEQYEILITFVSQTIYKL